MKGLVFCLFFFISSVIFAKSTDIDAEIDTKIDTKSQTVKDLPTVTQYLFKDNLSITDEFQDSDIDIAGYKIKFKGFFSAAGGVTTGKQFTSSVTGALTEPLYFGLRRQFTFESDSLAGVQLNAPISDELEVVLQVVARGRATDNVTGKYDLNATWAYVNYHFRDNLSIKIGRVLLPVYLLSQYVDVAYAYPWIKPPQELYGLLPVSNLNGAIGSWEIALNDEWQLELSPFFAANISQTPFVTGLIDVGLTNFVGLGTNISNDWLKIVAFYTTGNLKINDGNPVSVPVSSTATLTLPGFNIITSYVGVGLRAEKNNFLVLSEYAVRRTPGSYMNDVQSWYALFGYQIKKVMPFITYAQTNSLNKQRINILPPGLRGLMAWSLFQEQRSINVGVRYDVMDSVSFKVSLTHITPLNGTSGLFSDIPMQKSVNIYNMGLNLVF